MASDGCHRIGRALDGVVYPVFSAPSGYYFANAPRTVGVDIGFKF